MAIEQMSAARLQEIARMAADAIVEAVGDECQPHVETFRRFDPGKSHLPASDLHHLLRTAEHFYRSSQPGLSATLQHYGLLAQGPG